MQKWGGILSNTHKKIVIAFILGILISGTSVYAATKYKASDVIYKDTTVEKALNDLYAKDGRYYLYKDGDTYNDITGGYSSNYRASKWSAGLNAYITGFYGAKFTDNYIDLSLTNYPYMTVTNTVNKIDCQNYKYLNIVLSATKQYNLVYNFTENLTQNNYVNIYTNTQGPAVYYDNSGGHNHKATIKNEISCNESRYFALYTVRQNQSDPTSDTRIYEIYLSNE